MSVPVSPKNFRATIDKHNILFSWDKVSDSTVIGYKIYLNSVVIADIKDSTNLQVHSELNGELEGSPVVLSSKINLGENNAPLSNIVVAQTEIVEKSNVLNNSLKYKGFSKFISNFMKINQLFGKALFSPDNKTGKIKVNYEDFISILDLFYVCDGKFNYNNGEQVGEAYIVAYNADGESIASASISIKTSPNKVVNLIGAMVDGKFKLSWENNSSIAEGYKVQRLNENEQWETVQEINTITTKEYIETQQLQDNKIYKYRVCATNLSGDGEYSEYIYYVPLSPSWKFENGIFSLGFTDEVNALGYTLEYTLDGGLKQSVDLIGDGSNYTYDLEVGAGVVVEYCISAKLEANDSFPSRLARVNSNDYSPICIENYKSDWAEEGLARFTWSGHPRVKKYLVVYTLNDISQPPIEVYYDPNNEENTYSCEIRLLKNFDTISVKVQALNYFEIVETQSIEMIYVVLDEIVPPSNFRRSRTETGIRLEWTAQEFITKYVLYCTIDGTLQTFETVQDYYDIDIDYFVANEVSICIETHFINGAISNKTPFMTFSTATSVGHVKTTIYTKSCVEAYINGVYKSSGLIQSIPLDTSTRNIGSIKENLLCTLSYASVDVGFPIEMAIPSQVVTGHCLDATIISHKCCVEIPLNQINKYICRFDTSPVLTLCNTRVNIEHGIEVEIHKTRIVTMGDSITAGHPKYWAESGTGDPQSQYQYWLQRRLGENFEVLNKGYGRDTTKELLARFASTVLPLNAKYCIIQIGTNDIYQAITSGKDDQQVLDTAMEIARNNTISMVNICLENNIIPIVGNLIPRTGAKGIYRKALWEHNDWIKEFTSTTEGVHYVNFYDAGKGNIPPTPLEDPNDLGSMNPIYDGDTQYDEHGNVIVRGNGIHPNVEGYKLMGEAVPLSIFKSSTQGIKLFIDQECMIEEEFETSSTTGKVYKLNIQNILRGKEKVVTRYIKNIGIDEVIYAIYPVELNDMRVKFSVNGKDASHIASGLMVPKGSNKIDITIEVSKTSQSPELYLGVAGRITKTVI